MLTIIVSTYSLTNDIKQKQIYTVLTKPIRRFQLLFGKLLGVLLLDAALLALFSAIIYTITIYTPRFAEADETEIAQVENQFFTARASLTPPEVDVTREVREAYEKLDKTGQLDEFFSGLSRSKIIAYLTSRKKLEKRAAAVGHELLWEFHNVKPLDADESLFIRFKYDVSVNPPDLQVYSRWFAGDIRQIPYDIYTFDRKDLIRTFYEIEVPAAAVAEDGYLAVGFLNVPLNNTVVIFPPEDGLEVLYKADTFTGNFLKAVLLIFFRLVFLAVFSILASTFLSFPVAVLACLMIFFTATISGFVIESIDFMSEDLSGAYYYTIRPIVKLLPQFDKFNPTKFLVSAQSLTWPLLAKVAASMICIKALLLYLLALLIFSYREIAKVII